VNYMLATKYQDYMFGLLKKVIDEIGPRPPCSEAEKELGRLLVAEWKPICDRVNVETFICSPTALLGSIPVVALFYIACAILYWFLPPLALALAAVSCSILVLEVFQSREFVDSLFPRRQGENVIGTIRSKGQPTQRVIVSGHMDSAYEFTLFFYLKSGSIPAMVIGIAVPIIALGACLARTIAYFDVFSSDAALTGVGIGLIALSPLMSAFLFFTLWKPVPGANDNLSAVSVVCCQSAKVGHFETEHMSMVARGVSAP
jgi:hypothetical protein